MARRWQSIRGAVALDTCLALLACLWALAGCDRLFPQGSLPPNGVPASSTGASASPGPETTLTPAASPTPTPLSVRTLTIWLPPQLDPEAGTRQAELLKVRLDAFDEQHEEYAIETRLKALDGPGGLLDSLSTASAAAPQALPDLVALPRPLLETAALKGLVYPLDGLTSLLDEDDWYGYARQLATLQRSTFGLPFAGEALLLIYRPAEMPTPPVSWDDVAATDGILAFAAADPQAQFTLLQYQAIGGLIQDEQGRPHLEANPLEQVLVFYLRASQAGSMPSFLTAYETEDQAWQAFLGFQASMTVAWSSRYYRLAPQNRADIAAALVPVLGGDESPYTLATGWVWAVASPQPERQRMGIQLAEFLVDRAFLTLWTQAAGVLPPRARALERWQDAKDRSLAESLVSSAYLYPSSDLLSSLGPALRQATVDVLNQEKDPASAVQAALNQLQSP